MGVKNYYPQLITEIINSDSTNLIGWDGTSTSIIVGDNVSYFLADDPDANVTAYNTYVGFENSSIGSQRSFSVNIPIDSGVINTGVINWFLSNADFAYSVDYDISIYCGANLITTIPSSTFASANTSESYSFTSSELDLISNHNEITVKINSQWASSGSGITKTNWYVRIGSIKLNLDVATSSIPPNMPTNLSPSDNSTTSQLKPSFSGIITQSDNISSKLVIDISKDSTFATGVTTFQSTSSPSGSTITVAPTNSLSNGVWYWRAKALGDNGMSSSYTNTMILNINNIAPTLTNLIPSDKYISSSYDVTFQANLSDYEGGTVKLVVEYSTTSDFSSIVTQESSYVATGSNATFQLTFTANGNYYWRAKAIDNGDMYSQYSETRTIVISNIPPSVSNLTPANNTIVATNSVTIGATATDTDGVSYIEYEVYKDLGMSTLSYSGNMSANGNNYTVTISNLSQGNYYWRVRAKDNKNIYSIWTQLSGIFVNTPTTGRLSLDTVIAQTNLTGATVANLNDDPDTPNTTFATATANTSAMNIRVGFPTPPVALKTGAGLQQFKAWVKRSLSSSTSNPTVTISVYENGTSKVAGTATTVNNSTGMLVTFTWDATVLTDKTGATVEFYMTGTMVGSGSTRTTVSIGAVEWNYECVGATQTSASTNIAPNNVTNVVTTPSSSSVDVSWNNPSDTDLNYIEFYRNDVLQYNLVPSVTNITDVGLSSGVTYTYKLIAVDSAGNKSSPVSVNATTTLSNPSVTIVSVNYYRISGVTGMDRSTVIFTFDQDVTQWEVRVGGTGSGTGTIADSGGVVTSGTSINAIIDWTELSQEGSNRVNIYGKNSNGNWTPYNS